MRTVPSGRSTQAQPAEGRPGPSDDDDDDDDGDGDNDNDDDNGDYQCDDSDCDYNDDYLKPSLLITMIDDICHLFRSKMLTEKMCSEFCTPKTMMIQDVLHKNPLIQDLYTKKHLNLELFCQARIVYSCTM